GGGVGLGGGDRSGLAARRLCPDGRPCHGQLGRSARLELPARGDRCLNRSAGSEQRPTHRRKWECGLLLERSLLFQLLGRQSRPACRHDGQHGPAQRRQCQASYQVYNLGANSILAAYALGQVGSDWGFVTLGNFNQSDPSDMLLRNSTSGAFQIYDIADNNIIGSSSLGTVGLNWQVMGFGTFGSFGSFGSFGEDDMILRDVNTG